MKKKVLVLAEAASDIERGIDFYDAIEDGVGLYFRDSIIADIRRLGVYFGEHRIHLGYFRALSSRFPLRFTTETWKGRGRSLRCSTFDNHDWISDQLSARQ
jgi:hypothetical protein